MTEDEKESLARLLNARDRETREQGLEIAASMGADLCDGLVCAVWRVRLFEWLREIDEGYKEPDSLTDPGGPLDGAPRLMFGAGRYHPESYSTESISFICHKVSEQYTDHDVVTHTRLKFFLPERDQFLFVYVRGWPKTPYVSRFSSVRIQHNSQQSGFGR